MESRRAGQQTDGAGGRGRLGRLLRLLALLLVVLENDSHRHAELHRVADLLEEHDWQRRSQDQAGIVRGVGKVRRIHRDVPKLGAGAGDEEDGLLVVEAEQRILALLVRSEAELERGVHVVPVRKHVEGDERAEHRTEVRVEGAKYDAEARRRRAVRHHVQHRAKRGGLAEQPRREPIRSVESLRDDIGADGEPPVVHRVVVAHEGQHDPHVPDDIRRPE
mmetsp:Transcript_44890/g.144504  ORF Transcript_44890/g.144504 Transcript_44890/m.144504 type:complete len:220 (-) Transcript_44890:85-744(-)